ncbi:MAG: sugar ABC transporter ATP-binding protein [Treponema sp.]|nr:sugar ABC transporter ATP-binding protein [Treponema sp.]
MPEADPILSMRRISKSFPGVHALDKVDFALQRGEVRALMGENGAGKSTLIKVMTGVEERDEGRIFLDGREIDPHSPHEAQELGISTVYQEVNLIPTLTVAENIFLGRQPTSMGSLDWKKMNSSAVAALDRLNLELNVKRLLSDYSLAVQQMVAIARAVDVSAKMLILDEPTSSLSVEEVEQLFAVMRMLKAEGLGIVFVTHFLDQVFDISDTITVLRGGQLVGNFVTASTTRVQLIATMMGKELKELERGPARVASPDAPGAESLIEIKGLARKGSIEPFDLRLNKGEVLGLAGLLGAGRTEIANLLFGIDKAEQGNVSIEGEETNISSPRKAIAEGFALCPEDRKSAGIIGDLSIRENIFLALQASKGWFRLISRKTQQEIAERYITMLSISTPDADKKIKELSGGNQQKAIVARWLALHPRFLILDEPTRGIDVGAKMEIQNLILSLSREGISILFISSELSEVVRCSQRVAVLRDHVKIGEMSGDQIDESAIMHYIAEGAR